MKAVRGIPDGVDTFAILPIGDPRDSFGALLRGPVADVAYKGRWHEFLDEMAEQRCYQYVAANAEPIRTLHRAMNSKVERGTAMSFVCCDV